MISRTSSYLAALFGVTSVLASPTPSERSIEARWESFNYICTPGHIASLASGFSDLDAVTYHLGNITTAIVSNYNVTPSANGPMYPSASNLGFCNVTLSLSHDNLDDYVSGPCQRYATRH